MLILAIDTADARGSLALLRDQAVVAMLAHDSSEDYSSWLLPAANQLAASVGIGLADVELYAACAGPGSFTGLRVGLTAVKAWSEIHSRPIAAVSRLETIATLVAEPQPWVAAFFDAHRKQVFGGLYRWEGNTLRLAGEEMVITP
ncbi:MAG TPA: tRNA (adenosine(37)-N6)-threonylcarbamoyltransferase complex dimerization subunit type 1 TsaB, partial [Candidatus Acidoferrum sp.]|nr:tRNA (adenosine(37)-N6)-threonylcarbamoyltransferase complex dimerization subunit type 1 TsaB [Candidatus Acidoferrum sp.]